MKTERNETRMFKRRHFLILGSFLGLSQYLNAKESSAFDREFIEIRATIAAVQEHMFPEGSKLPSARSMNATQFLHDTVEHKSFDRDIRAFVLEGAKELMDREKNSFVTMTKEEQEKALRAYEETSYGSNWLARIITITMEGLFCDPIYGSNVNEAAWKDVGSFGGFPRAKTRYLES